MLRLRLDTTYLDLDPGTALTLTVHNPLFDADGAEALYSFPFTLPATPRNLETLSHANRLDISSNVTQYPGAVLEVEGVPFDAGILELDEQKFTNAGIGAIYKNSVPGLMEELEKIKINEILETIDVPQVTDAWWQFPLTTAPSSAGITYSITIDLTLYSYTTPGSVPNAAVTQSLALAINADHPGLADAGFYDELRLFSSEVNDVEINLGTLVNLEMGDYTTPGQAAQANLQDFINDISWAPIDQCSFPYLYWEKFYKDLVTGYNNRINAWVDGTFIDNAEAAGKFAWLTTFIPFVRIAYILDKIAENVPDFFTTHAGFFADDPDGSDTVVFNNRSLDQLYYDRYPNAGFGEFKYLNGFKQSIELNRHVPEMTAAEFVLKLVEGFALWMRIVGTSITFVKKRDQLNSDPIDWTHLSEPSYQATRRFRGGFTIKYPDIREEDKFFLPSSLYASQLTPYVLGEGKEIVELPFGSCKISGGNVGIPGSGLVKCPVMNQAGSSDEGGIEDNEYSFRIIFDRGLQLTSTSDNYVQASSDNTDYFDDPTGDLSLDLNAADGLYHLHHKGIVQLLADGQPVTLALRLGIEDILEARKWTNARRTIKLPDGHVTAVIKSIQVRVTTQGIGISLVEMVQEK